MRTRSRRRISTTALLIVLYTNWISYGTGQVSLEEEAFGTASYPLSEIGKIAHLQELRMDAAEFNVSRVQLNIAWLRLISPIVLLLISLNFSAQGDPYRKEPGKEPAVNWFSTSLQALRLRLIQHHS